MPEAEPTLWLGSCPRCAGEGVIRLDLPEADPDDLYTCRDCGGSGLAEGETHRRRLREDD